MDCSMPGFPVLYLLLELAQTHVPWVGDVIQPSCPLSSPSPPAFNLSQHRGKDFFVCKKSFLYIHSLYVKILHTTFVMSWLFASGCQSIGTSASSSVLPMNIQDWFPLGLTDLISLQSKGSLNCESEREEWNSWLKYNIQKLRSWHLVPSLHGN